MEENNDIFLASDDALVYLPNQCTKNIPQQLFGAIHLVRTYLMIDFLTPLSQYTPVHIFHDPPPFLQLRTYLMDGLFLNQKTNKKIRISYSLKYKHSKKNFFTKK